MAPSASSSKESGTSGPHNSDHLWSKDRYSGQDDRHSWPRQDEFHNGEHYFQYERVELWMPKVTSKRPNREFLEWHF